MANGKKATINGKATVQRLAGRLTRVRRAIVGLERTAQDASILDVPYRRRCKDKVRALKREEQALADQLASIRSAINDTIDA